MATSSDFLSLHARIHSCGGQKLSLYEIGRQLSGKQLQTIVQSLNTMGLPVKKLEFYEYGPSDALRHLFVIMKNSPTPIPYYILDVVSWHMIVREILKTVEEK